MRILKTITLVLGLLAVIVGCSFNSSPQSEEQSLSPFFGKALDDNRFIVKAALTAVSAQGVVLAIGEPDDKVPYGCSLPIQISRKLRIPLFGEAWTYENHDKRMQVERYLCVVDGLVIADKTMFTETHDGRILVYFTETVDSALAKAIMMQGLKLKDVDKLERNPGLEI